MAENTIKYDTDIYNKGRENGFGFVTDTKEYHKLIKHDTIKAKKAFRLLCEIHEATMDEIALTSYELTQPYMRDNPEDRADMLGYIDGLTEAQGYIREMLEDIIDYVEQLS